MLQAITTTYIGATNYKGSRVKAKSQAGNVMVSWDHSLDINENHTAAAKALAEKYDWKGEWVGGASPDGRGFVFVRSCAGLIGGFKVEG